MNRREAAFILTLFGLVVIFFLVTVITYVPE